MERASFLKLLTVLPLFSKAEQLNTLIKVSASFPKTEKMPVFFVGHGDPRNAFRDNPFTRSLTTMSNNLAVKPVAVLVISAHWLTLGETLVSTKASYETPEYKAAGSPGQGRLIMQDIPDVKDDPDRDLDHGAWAILKHLFPAADVPVIELSIDMAKPMDYHWKLAQQLQELRNKGILIIGSGNIVHNLELSALKMVTFSKKPYHWATGFDEWVKARIIDRDFSSLFYYYKLGKMADMAVPTLDHYIPMLYSLALVQKNEPITFTYEEVLAGVSMRCMRIG